ncbi:MAG TPA: hypothetical protein VGM53_14685 [Streptosporangiaceae bacterium]|jgi:transcriptional regulator with XRE-family HTH domain
MAATSGVVDVWTGRRASALRAALRMTIEEFAAHLGVAARTVAYWNTRPAVVPKPELQRALDTMLASAGADERARFGLLAIAGPATTSTAGTASAEQLRARLDWLAGELASVTRALALTG